MSEEKQNNVNDLQNPSDNRDIQKSQFSSPLEPDVIKQDTDSTSSGMRTIMVAEDDMFISDIYDVKLTSAGYNVIIANNGRDALEKLSSGIHPHLLLLDIVMPYMDGFDVLEAIAKNSAWQNIPVVLLTNLSQKEDRITSSSRILRHLKFLRRSKNTS